MNKPPVDRVFGNVTFSVALDSASNFNHSPNNPLTKRKMAANQSWEVVMDGSGSRGEHL